MTKLKTVQKDRKPDPLAKHSAMWADQYALTMSQALFHHNKHEQVTTFHAYIRKAPFGGGYLVSAGQNILLEWLENWTFDEDDIEILRAETSFNSKTRQHERIYSDAFIDMLKETKLNVTIDMMPEGELAFPDEPIVRVTGPVWQCLMVEAAILNTINSQSLLATLASRFREIAGGKTVLELGLRRAQMLGGLEASRAGYIGGMDGSSNYLAKKYYGIPTSGTMAHALVMLYEDELAAFSDYAEAMPNSTVFLVDTFDTIEGVKRAIEICKKMNIDLKGVRLDSGDLAYLSRAARKVLDDAGFKDAKIVASNSLNVDLIKSLEDQDAKIDKWGVGTEFVTSKAQSALGGVYKLAAVYDSKLSVQDVDKMIADAKNGAISAEDFKGKVRGVIKLSEQNVKTSIPGALDVVRFMRKNHLGHWMYDGDMIYNAQMKNILTKSDDKNYPLMLKTDVESVRKTDETLSKVFNAGTYAYQPLIPAFKNGARICEIETVHDARNRVKKGLQKLNHAHKRLENPHTYVAGLENSLFEERRRKIINVRRGHYKSKTSGVKKHG